MNRINFSKKVLLIFTLVSLTQVLAIAGDKVGGGGDASEARVEEIRKDILSWIKRGGSKSLVLPPGVSIEIYNEEMINVVQSKKVLVSFVENDDSSDEELRVQVDGIPKTCRSFESRSNYSLRILCNIGRFARLTESEQYRLIHHEFAALAGVERNYGATSNYEISNQLSDYLEKTEVLRLSIKRVTDSRSNYEDSYIQFRSKLDILRIRAETLLRLDRIPVDMVAEVSRALSDFIIETYPNTGKIYQLDQEASKIRQNFMLEALKRY